mmetsp:Transcript_1310/g.1671  ORF Transcript_1310/g.1671 Transcript_1310/m.1671 type:complete len:88 (-) Transcript_1310:425-688(-)
MRRQCDICDKEHNDNCYFAFDDDVEMETILKLLKYNRELELTINWKQNSKAHFKILETPTFNQINLTEAPKSNSGVKSVYDCLCCFS